MHSSKNILSIEQRILLDHLITPRTGWVTRGVPEDVAETVRAHTLKVMRAVQLFATAQRGFNPDKAMRYAIVHDFPEILAPDYMPGQIALGEKHKQEFASLAYTSSFFGEAGKQILSDWKEFEAQDTPEAKIVFQFDKMCPAIKSLEYAKQGYRRMDEFIPYAQKRITDVRLQKIFAQVLERRNERNAYLTYYSLLRAA